MESLLTKLLLFTISAEALGKLNFDSTSSAFTQNGKFSKQSNPTSNFQQVDQHSFNNDRLKNDELWNHDTSNHGTSNHDTSNHEANNHESVRFQHKKRSSNSNYFNFFGDSFIHRSFRDQDEQTSIVLSLQTIRADGLILWIPGQSDAKLSQFQSDRYSPKTPIDIQNGYIQQNRLLYQKDKNFDGIGDFSNKLPNISPNFNPYQDFQNYNPNLSQNSEFSPPEFAPPEFASEYHQTADFGFALGAKVIDHTKQSAQIDQYIFIQAKNSRIFCYINLGAGEQSLGSPAHIRINSGEEHFFRITRSKHRMSLTYKNSKTGEYETQSAEIPTRSEKSVFNIISGAYVGGLGWLDDTHSKRVHKQLTTFRGCIQELKFNNIDLLSGVSKPGTNFLQDVKVSDVCEAVNEVSDFRLNKPNSPFQFSLPQSTDSQVAFDSRNSAIQNFEFSFKLLYDSEMSEQPRSLLKLQSRIDASQWLEVKVAKKITKQLSLFDASEINISKRRRRRRRKRRNTNEAITTYLEISVNKQTVTGWIEIKNPEKWTHFEILQGRGRHFEIKLNNKHVSTLSPVPFAVVHKIVFGASDKSSGTESVPVCIKNLIADDVELDQTFISKSRNMYPLCEAPEFELASEGKSKNEEITIWTRKRESNVVESGVFIFSRRDIDVLSDTVSIYDLDVEIVEEPKFGILQVHYFPVEVGQVFSFSDVLRGSFSYKHVGSAQVENGEESNVTDENEDDYPRILEKKDSFKISIQIKKKMVDTVEKNIDAGVLSNLTQPFNIRELKLNILPRNNPPVLELTEKAFEPIMTVKNMKNEIKLSELFEIIDADDKILQNDEIDEIIKQIINSENSKSEVEPKFESDLKSMKSGLKSSLKSSLKLNLNKYSITLGLPPGSDSYFLLNDDSHALSTITLPVNSIKNSKIYVIPKESDEILSIIASDGELSSQSRQLGIVVQDIFASSLHQTVEASYTTKLEIEGIVTFMFVDVDCSTTRNRPNSQVLLETNNGECVFQRLDKGNPDLVLEMSKSGEINRNGSLIWTKITGGRIGSEFNYRLRNLFSGDRDISKMPAEFETNILEFKFELKVAGKSVAKPKFINYPVQVQKTSDFTVWQVFMSDTEAKRVVLNEAKMKKSENSQKIGELDVAPHPDSVMDIPIPPSSTGVVVTLKSVKPESKIQLLSNNTNVLTIGEKLSEFNKYSFKTGIIQNNGEILLPWEISQNMGHNNWRSFPRDLSAKFHFSVRFQSKNNPNKWFYYSNNDIQVQVDYQPTIIGMKCTSKSPIIVDEGGKKLVTFQNIHAEAIYHEIKFRYEVMKTVEHGKILGVKNNIFTDGLLAEGKISYEHDDSETKSDSLLVVAVPYNVEKLFRQGVLDESDLVNFKGVQNPCSLDIVIRPVNDQKPVNLILSKGRIQQLVIAKGQLNILSNKVINWGDADNVTSNVDLVYTKLRLTNGRLVKLPKTSENADLVKISDSRSKRYTFGSRFSRSLEEIESFTQSELDSNLIGIQHVGKLQGLFKYTVSDGRFTEPGMIRIKAERPRLDIKINGPIECSHGKSGKFDSGKLDIQSNFFVEPANLIFTVQKSENANFGNFVRDGRRIGRFTLLELESGKIEFKHSGESVTLDGINQAHFLLKYEIGALTKGEISIQSIVFQDWQESPPIFEKIKPLTIHHGQMATLSSEFLEVIHTSSHISPENITFSCDDTNALLIICPEKSSFSMRDIINDRIEIGEIAPAKMLSDVTQDKLNLTASIKGSKFKASHDISVIVWPGNLPVSKEIIKVGEHESVHVNKFIRIADRYLANFGVEDFMVRILRHPVKGKLNPEVGEMSYRKVIEDKFEVVGDLEDFSDPVFVKVTVPS